MRVEGVLRVEGWGLRVEGGVWRVEGLPALGVRADAVVNQRRRHLVS